MAIQFRRGDYDDLNGNSLLDGEPVITTQDDPNTTDGRGFYIKNGTLKRVLTEGDLEESAWTLLDTITVSSSTHQVELFTTASTVKEYLIVLHLTFSDITGEVYLQLGTDDYVYSAEILDETYYYQSMNIERLVGNDALISSPNQSKIIDIDNKVVKLNAQPITINSGTITIYAR